MQSDTSSSYSSYSVWEEGTEWSDLRSGLASDGVSDWEGRAGSTGYWFDYAPTAAANRTVQRQLDARVRR